MDSKCINILLIDNDFDDSNLIRQLLANSRGYKFELESVKNLSEAMELLNSNPYDILLLDFATQESKGLEELDLIFNEVPEVPILVLTDSDDESFGVKAVQKGAQDYLFKEEISKNLLIRTINYSIERNRLQMELKEMAHIDELTRLYNRRGFKTLARQQIKLAERTNRGLLLVFADLDNMKKINDTIGHFEGDRALIDIARILKKNFRESDIVARLGGDEFIVLAIDFSEKYAELISSRIQENLLQLNSIPDRKYQLSLSMGITHFDPKEYISIDEMIKIADKLMYEEKNKKKLCAN